MYRHENCHIFYPDNERIKEYAISYCDSVVSEEEVEIDYIESDAGDFKKIVYPDDKTFYLNQDYSDIELEIEDKKVLSEMFIYEYKKSENDVAYTSKFLEDNHYSNIYISDFNAKVVDDLIEVHSNKYDFTFTVEFAYSPILFGKSFGYEKEYIKQTYVSNNRPVIALTYDDGPYTKIDKQLYEVFDLHDSRCTFFIVGNRISDSELENIKEGIALGNEYGSHTYNHADIRRMKDEDAVETMLEPFNILNDSLGYQMKMYRQPYGYRNLDMEEALKEQGLISVLWNVDSLDWKTRDEESTINEVVNCVNGGEIVLMHCLYDSTLEATKKIIPTLIDAGYQLVTVSELMNICGISEGPVYGQ